MKKLSAGLKATHSYFTHDQLDSGQIPAPFDAICRQIRILQKRLGMDFAALDLVLDQTGTLFIVDVNATPWAGSLRPDHPLLFHLRKALNTVALESRY